MKEEIFSGVQQGEKPVVEAHMVILMRPLFTVGRWFGVFPLELNILDPDRALYQEKLSFNYFRSLLILLLALIYMSFHVISIGISISKRVSGVEVLAQSLWLQPAVLSFLVQFRFLRSPQSFISLFTKDWKAVEADCGRVFSAPDVRRFARNCFLLYVGLGLTSAILIAFHSVQIPTYPVYILHYVHLYNTPNCSIWSPHDPYLDPHHFTNVTLTLHTLGQVFFILWKWSGSAMLDVTLCIYGYVINTAMLTTIKQVDTCMVHCPEMAHGHSNGAEVVNLSITI